MRKGKTLWTRKPLGEKITLFEAKNPREEAEFVVSIIRDSGRAYRDFLILYRTNAQSRSFEEALISQKIPYQIVGTVRFYERMEIKDLVAYLKVIVNPRDDLSLERIINVPQRGIGKQTLQSLKSLGNSLNISLFETLSHVDLLDGVRVSIKEKIKELERFLLNFMAIRDEKSVHEVLLKLINEIDYFRYIEEKSLSEEEAESRRENIEEFLNMAESFSFESEENRVADFLGHISTFTEIDTWQENRDSVNLMTIHNAKGLEFPVVIITGLEEKIFPHRSSHDDPYQLEEERRLFHVALTRAQEKVVLTYSKTRYWLGDSEPSRFLEELPRDVLEYSGELFEEREGRGSVQIGNEALSPGDRVFHPQFGMGKVLELYEGKAKILFKIGVRTIMVDMSPLKKV